MGRVVAEEEGRYLDHRKDNGDGGENWLGRSDVREILQEIHGIDGHIQW